MKNIIYFFIFLWPFRIQAQDIAHISDTLYSGGTFITRIIHLASFICSLIFIAASIAGYREHRNNPKFVPLMKPVLLFILGLILLILPYADRFLGETNNPLHNFRHEKRDRKIYGIDPDAPLH